MRKIIIFVLVALLLFGSCSCGGKEDIKTNDPVQIDRNSEYRSIIKNGESEYCIVIAKNCALPTTYAARELNLFLKESTDVELPVVTDEEYLENDNPDYKVFSLGKNKVLSNASLNFDYSEIAEEGFFVKTSGNGIYIDSNTDTGLFYGIYEFLDKYLNALFFLDESFYIDKTSELKVYDTNIVESPAFKYREYGTKTDTFLQTLRMRYHRGTTYSEQLGKNLSSKDFYDISEGHTFYKMVPYTQYKDEHPEWFLLDGSNWDLTNGMDDEGNIPADKDTIFHKALEVLKQIIIDNPEKVYFMVGQPDNARTNPSQRAKLLKDKFGGESGLLMVFINNLAEEIEKWINETDPGREVYIVSFAYQGTRYSPSVKDNSTGEFLPAHKKVKARDNVVIRLCFECCNYHSLADENCVINKKYYEQLKGWQSIASHLFVWTYSINFRDYLVYAPFVRTMKDNFIMYRDCGTLHMYNNAIYESNLYTTCLQSFLFSKLMWNPEQDVNQLISKHNKAWFGDVADDYVNEYLYLMDSHIAYLDATYDDGYQTDLYEGADYLSTKNWPLAVLNKAINILETAMKKVKESDSLTKDEKDLYIKRLYQTIITPREMIYRNLNAYIQSSVERESFTKVYNETIKKAGIKMIAPGNEIVD